MRFVLDTDAFKENLEFYSSYDDENYLGKIYVREADKNDFISEQIARFAKALMLSLEVEKDTSSFGSLYEKIGRGVYLGERLVMCPHCKDLISESMCKEGFENCPRCGKDWSDI